MQMGELSVLGLVLSLSKLPAIRIRCAGGCSAADAREWHGD